MIWITDIIPTYLSLILTWPVLGSATVALFLVLFSDSIRKFLEENRVSSAGPGGLTFEQKQQPATEPTKERLEEGEELRKEYEKISKELTKKSEEAQRSDTLLLLQSQISQMHEFAYLNLFFVQNTKSVLKWFYDNQATLITKDLYNLSYQQIIPDALQRETILSALMSNDVIDLLPNGGYRINQKGKDFLTYIGLVKS